MTEFSLSSINKVNNMLSKETQNTNNCCWNKLPKKIKLEQIVEFTNTYSIKHNLSEEIKTILNTYLKICVDRKKLHKKNDIKYNLETKQIEEIPNLIFSKINKKFTIKKSESANKTKKTKKLE